jgi:hypothetical protein
VHLVDNHLLPGVGEVQDPVDGGAEVPPDGPETLLLVVLNSRTVETWATVGGGGLTTDLIATYTLTSNGDAWGTPYLFQVYQSTGEPDHYADEWLFNKPVETSQAGLFEVYAEQLSGDALSSGTLDTWLPLDTTRQWVVTSSASETWPIKEALLRIRIRLASSGVVQDEALVTIKATSFAPG